MIVAELIEKLREMPQGAEVMICVSHCEETGPLTGVYLHSSNPFRQSTSNDQVHLT